jgi:methionyl-tRNA formyltransferase
MTEQLLHQETTRKKLVMCGCHEGYAYKIRKLLEDGVQFSHFVMLTPEQGEKYDVSGYFDYTEMARQYNIPVYIPKTYKLSHPEDQAFFLENRFDVLIQGGWQRLFPHEVLNALSIGALGYHGSPDFLPQGRGRSPLNWSLIQDKKRFLFHLFLMKPGADDGDIIDFEQFDITDYDTIKTLYYKCNIVAYRLVRRNLIDILNGQTTFIPQEGEPSYFLKRTAADAWIQWDQMDVREVYNFVRAQTRPYPGAFGKVGDRWLKIWACQPFDNRITYPGTAYGSLVETFEGDLLLNCLGGVLLVSDYEWLEEAPTCLNV